MQHRFEAILTMDANDAVHGIEQKNGGERN
jgi:hypothetical protein